MALGDDGLKMQPLRHTMNPPLWVSLVDDFSSDVLHVNICFVFVLKRVSIYHLRTLS